MSYVLEKKAQSIKRRKYFFLFFVLALFVYFHAPIFHFLSSGFNIVFYPIMKISVGVKDTFNETVFYFKDKQRLAEENIFLKSKIQELETRFINYNSLVSENLNLKNILGRKHEEQKQILASVLSGPNGALYDTLLLDVGEKDGVLPNSLVFASGDLPIGSLKEVGAFSSKVLLFSDPKQKLEVRVPGSDSLITLEGLGGGSFEAFLPRDFEIKKGEEVVLPGIKPYVIAVVKEIISDPRDSYKKVLFALPINPFELRFVQIETND